MSEIANDLSIDDKFDKSRIENLNFTLSHAMSRGASKQERNAKENRKYFIARDKSSSQSSNFFFYQFRRTPLKVKKTSAIKKRSIQKTFHILPAKKDISHFYQ
jgi:hypothetical protein